jgi:hypothetical protein
LGILAEDELASPTGLAVVAVASMPAEADALTDFEEWNVGGDGVKDSGDFVTGDAGVGDAGKEAVLGEVVAVADAASLHPDANVARTGLGEFFFDEFKRGLGGWDLNGTASHGWHKHFLLASWLGEAHRERCRSGKRDARCV